MTIRSGTLMCLGAVAACATPAPEPSLTELSLASTGEAVEVRVNGERFARLLVERDGPVALTHLRAPGGRDVLRGFPLAPRAGESADHPEQTGAWIGHASVDGEDLWSFGRSGARAREHLVKVEGPDLAFVDVDLEWIGTDGETLCTEERRYSFWAQPGVRAVDVDQSLATTANGLAMGDVKDGYFALRLSDAFRWGPGTRASALASTGAKDDDAWGERARWVARSATLQGDDGRAETVTVVVLDHRTNPLHPPSWSVRRYGLLAANPFGRAAYTGDEMDRTANLYDAYVTLDFQYRVLVVDGELAYDEIDRLWETFSERESPL